MGVIAPIVFMLKCPNCGEGIPLSDLIDKSSFSIKGKVARCNNCNKNVTWSRASIRNVAGWVYAFTAFVFLFLIVTSIWKDLNVVYMSIPVTMAMLCVLFAIRSAKLTVVSE
jgi:endogenous inhibitor of DNA gyrase (YacG/DUF329 family)